MWSPWSCGTDSRADAAGGCAAGGRGGRQPLAWRARSRWNARIPSIRACGADHNVFNMHACSGNHHRNAALAPHAGRHDLERAHLCTEQCSPCAVVVRAPTLNGAPTSVYGDETPFSRLTTIVSLNSFRSQNAAESEEGIQGPPAIGW